MLYTGTRYIKQNCVLNATMLSGVPAERKKAGLLRATAKDASLSVADRSNDTAGHTWMRVAYDPCDELAPKHMHPAPGAAASAMQSCLQESCSWPCGSSRKRAP